MLFRDLLETVKATIGIQSDNTLALGAAISIGSLFLLKSLWRPTKTRKTSPLPPKFFLKFIDFLYRKLNWIEQALIPPELQVVRHGVGFLYPKALFVVAHLKVADSLANGPKTAEQLALELHVNTDRLSRLLRLLAQVGIFKEHSNKTFSNTNISALLQENHPNSQRPFILHLTYESYSAADELLGAVTTGEPAIVRKFGKNVWDFFAEHPDLKNNFAKAMQSLDKINTPLLIEGYDWTTVGTVADVGGSLGTFLEAVLEQSPNSKGVLFDLPDVIELAKQQPRWQGPLAPRVQFVGGSFFNSVPVADTYMLRFIIHDWSDESSTKILQTIRKSIPSHGKVLICDMIHPDFGQNPDAVFRISAVDTLMMINCEGKERTEEEFAKLFSASGFKLKKVYRTKGAIAIIEGVPV